MKLKYRGISYEYNSPVVETVTSVTVGKYRGLDIRFRYAKKAPVMEQNYNLTYRGVKYNTQPNTDNVSESEKTRLLGMENERTDMKPSQSILGKAVEELG